MTCKRIYKSWPVVQRCDGKQQEGKDSMAQPNILLILSDDHGFGDVSHNGGPHVQTPNIDRIATSGVQFTNFYANSSVCSPSRAALMTGRYPDRVGVPGVIRTHENNSWGYFRQDAVTMADMLKRAGYYTAIVGKWHLGLEPENHPCQRGFAHFQGFLGDMMDDYLTHRRHDTNYMQLEEQEIDPEGHATDLFTDWAGGLIRQQAGSAQPFFLYLAYNAPHTPIQPPEEWVERVREREPEASPQRVKYCALVEHMDAGIGHVLEALEETDQLNNTLVIYVSDNGGYMDAGADCGPYRGQKGDMYEGGIRVPACAMWPGHIPVCTTSDTIALLMDLFPTVCEVAGLKVDHEIEGTSILPTLMGDEQPELGERELYWIRREGGMQFLGLCQHAVRKGPLKLLHNGPFQPLQMFDLESDPKEEADRSGEDDASFRQMAQLLNTTMQDNGAVPWRSGEG